MTLSLMPKDLPLPVEPYDQISNQSTSQPLPVRDGPDGIFPYDPWLNANVAKMADRSQPETGGYGEPTYITQGGSITAEWGGMPSPVRGFADIDGSVLQLRRVVHRWPRNEVTGRFNGAQQTAWEYSYQEPVEDYWSVILGE